MKPIEIINLEKELGIEIYLATNHESFTLNNEENTYFFEQGTVTGLSLLVSGKINFLNNFPDLKKLLIFGKIDDTSPISTLTKIEELHLEDNDLLSLEFLKALNQIKVLEIRHNNISDISILSNYTNLEKLNLWSNKITDISNLKNLKKLTHLTLWDNSIIDISPLKNLQNIYSLDLDGNKINNLNPLKNLNNLKTLYLSYNPLTDINPISNIKSLRSLNITNIKGLDINPLGKLKNLSSLNLSGCDIYSLESLKDLKKLNDLILSSNNINDLKFLKDLISLELLKIDNNQITELSYLKNLVNLKTLLIQENFINEISVLKDFHKLKNLNLNGNKIKDLRPILHIIETGIAINTHNPMHGLKVENNPLEYPPLQTIKEGNLAIIRFFKKIDLEGEDTIYEAKLTLVGEGSSGKTSLLGRLLDGKSSFPQEKNRTRGISIVDWIFKEQKNKKHMAHIWDFGGQDVYYPVHRFFLTENSVFVLLASSRQNTHHFDYWIPTIYQFGGKSPIIIGQTCHDGNIVNWNDIGEYVASENFNIVKDQPKNYHELNLPKGNKGLVQIKKSIINQIINLPHYKKNVPKSWIAVREMIYTLKSRNCISYIDLKERIINLNPESFRAKEDVEDCVNFFHSIGIILWYNTESQLRDWVILNPKWAVDAVYKIIDFKKNSRQGIILAEDFDIVWKAKIYDNMHNILKDMLEVFKIAFPKKNNRTDYIMPTRLQSMRTEDKWDENENMLFIEYHYEFMPKGLVNQISAELSRYIPDDNQVWNNGVNFYDNETSSQVFEDFYNRKIIVKSTGNDARALIMIIMNAIKDITDGYKGVVPKIIIPCTCAKCLIKKDSTTFKYDMLLDKIKENKDARVYCNISEDSFRVEALLYNIGLPNPSKKLKDEATKKEIKMELKTYKIFLASSSELINERKSFREFISLENDRLHKKGIYFQIIQWEYFLDQISNSRLQDEYNSALKNSDIALCFFFTKVGKFTEEEFDTAYDKFSATGTPKIWTYFKNATIQSNDINESINTLLKFKEKLKDIGHFYSNFDSNSDLHLQFKRQLDIFLDEK